MSEDRIESETLIAAPRSGSGRWWLSPGSGWPTRRVCPGPWPRRGVDDGEEYRARRLSGAGGEGGAAHVSGVPVDQRVPREELREANSTLVEFTLTREGEQTRLRVVESGFAALAASEEVRGQNLKDHAGGWPLELDALKSRAEQPAA